MSRPRLVQIISVDEVRDAAPRWDDLWWRSEVTCPAVRAEMVAQWLEQFSPRGNFQALVVEDQGQWAAALPLVHSSLGPLLGTAGTTSNEWSPSGDLLIDPSAPVDTVLEVMVDGLRKIPWPLLWLKDVPSDTPRWEAFRQAVDRRGMPSDHHRHTEVGRIEIGPDWETFRRRLSKKHRSKMARCDRRLAERGEVRLEMLGGLDPQQVEPRLREAFEIEDRSWKGQGGTSVLQSPGIFEYFVRQARQLAEWGQLELAFLHCGETPVAFVYGYGAKGVSYWNKIGYDPDYGCCTPGQLLQCHLLEAYHSQPDRRVVDTMGPLTRALAQWNPTPRAAGRLAVAPRSLVGRLMLYAYQRGARYRRGRRGGKGGENVRTSEKQIGEKQPGEKAPSPADDSHPVPV